MYERGIGEAMMGRVAMLEKTVRRIGWVASIAFAFAFSAWLVAVFA
jgi:hypothetical protein